MNTMRFFTTVLVSFFAALSVASDKTISLKSLRGKKVAVTVFAQNEQAEPLTQAAQARMEAILNDNEVNVLDEEKTKELQDVFTTLEDPAAFVTAETFIENSEKYNIDALLSVYLSADVDKGLADYYSAAAHADVRFIDDDTAKVAAFSTPPMGLVGSPLSDALSKMSAAVNATQRAIDALADTAGMDIGDRIRARSVRLVLRGPVRDVYARIDARGVQNERQLWDMAELEDQKWRTEEVTCTARSPGGALAALCGYVKDTDFHRRPNRLYGSRVHLVDLAKKKSVKVFECSPVEKSTKEEPNSKSVLDCMFVSNWRYLVALTGNHLLMWDTERGELLSKISVPNRKASLGFVKGADGGSMVIVDGKTTGKVGFRIVRDN